MKIRNKERLPSNGIEMRFGVLMEKRVHWSSHTYTQVDKCIVGALLLCSLRTILA